MHKVSRNGSPKELENKNAEIRTAIKNKEEINPTVEWKNFSKTKLKKEVVDALDSMYSGCCCYCESKVGITDYRNIEHLKPKQKFPEDMFDYNNMHLSCEFCNTTKNNNYFDGFIDPSTSNPELHIKYESYCAVGQDDIGNETLEIIKINEKIRNELILNRKVTLDCFLKKRASIMECFTIIIRDRNVSIDIKKFIKSEAQQFMEEVKENSRHGKPYCTMIKHNSEDLIEEISEILSTPTFVRI